MNVPLFLSDVCRRVDEPAHVVDHLIRVRRWDDIPIHRGRRVFSEEHVRRIQCELARRRGQPMPTGGTPCLVQR